jgi:hypothetical protein
VHELDLKTVEAWDIRPCPAVEDTGAVDEYVCFFFDGVAVLFDLDLPFAFLLGPDGG